MTEEEQLALLEHVVSEGSFKADDPLEETPEEKAARRAFEQRILRASTPRLREMGGKLGVLPKLVIEAANVSGETLAEVIIHAYRHWGLRLTGNTDVVYHGANVPSPENPQKREEREKDMADTDFWDDNDGILGLEDDTPKAEKADAENTEEKPPKGRSKTKRTKKAEKAEKEERPSKSAIEAKIDDVVKASMASSEAIRSLEDRLKAVHTEVSTTKKSVDLLSGQLDQLLVVNVRTWQLLKNALKLGFGKITDKMEANAFIEKCDGVSEKITDKVREKLGMTPS